jgi:hypothetical protein
MTFDEWMKTERPTYHPSDDSAEDRRLRRCWDAAVAVERSRSKSSTVSRPEGVSEQAWADWLRARKAKRLPLTPTAWDRFCRDAANDGKTPAEAVAICAEKGWAGYYTERAAPRVSERPNFIARLKEHLNAREIIDV